MPDETRFTVSNEGIELAACEAAMKVDASRYPGGIETPLRKIAAELLRLYDWRFELAREEAELRNTPIQARDIREVASLPPQSFDASALEMRRAALDKKLRQYGREKKAAWDALRKELDTRPVVQEPK